GSIRPATISSRNCIYSPSKRSRSGKVLRRPWMLLPGSSLELSLQAFAPIKMQRRMSSIISYVFQRDVNFIYLDWDRCKYEWRDALASLRVMAAQASRLLNHFVQHFGAHPSRFHLIGHSWGGHLAAYIARNIKGCKRLTGLDPAYFYFWSNSKEIQIKKDDAEFVEIGHTANLPIVGVGIREPKGHIDYYFNGNWLQPSCILEGTRTFVKKFKEEGTFDALRCRYTLFLFLLYIKIADSIAVHRSIV
ncbi:hypothetical protein C0J52_09833, partial [Blattella germanica]